VREFEQGPGNWGPFKRVGAGGVMCYWEIGARERAELVGPDPDGDLTTGTWA